MLSRTTVATMMTRRGKNVRRLYRGRRSTGLTWWSAVNPSTFPVLMSAPFSSRRTTSSLSPAAHAARKTQSAENLILRAICRGSAGSLLVSDCSQRLSCSALLKRAELERVSRDMFQSRMREPMGEIPRTQHTSTKPRWAPPPSPHPTAQTLNHLDERTETFVVIYYYYYYYYCYYHHRHCKIIEEW